MKIKLRDSAKRIFANTFSPKHEGKDALVKENIKKDVQIFDVVGTYECGDGPPTPSELVPFEAGQVITGYQFDTSAESEPAFLEWLTSLDYSQTQVELVGQSDGHGMVLGAGYFQIPSGEWAYILVVANGDYPVYVYSTEEIQGYCPKGWNTNVIVDGRYMVSESPKTVGTVVDTTPASWNGVFIGAVVGGPTPPTPPTLTEFKVGDIINGFDFGDVQLYQTDSNLENVLRKICGQTEFSNINLMKITDKSAFSGTVLFCAQNQGTLALAAWNGKGNPFMVYSSAPIPGQIEVAGWQVSGIVAIDSDIPFEIASIESGETWSGSDWNGIFVGNAPQQPTTTYQIYSAIENGLNIGDSSINQNGTATITIKPDAGYTLPSTITQSNITNATYNNDYNNGTFTISDPTGDVTISASCPSDSPTPPTPGTLTPFQVGDIVSGLDFGGQKQEYTHSSEMDSFLEGASYGSLLEDANKNAILEVYDGGKAKILRVYNSTIATEGNWFNIYDTVNGWSSLPDTVSLYSSVEIYHVYDTTPETWNGILIGKV